MAIVTQHLTELIAKQVEDHGLVVWYDPDGDYADVAQDLSFPKTTLTRYDGSFFALRRSIDNLMSGEQPPRLVVYVPMDQSKSHRALIELEKAGVIMQPGQQPPTRNTRLAVVARNAFRSIYGEDSDPEIERQVESGQLTLVELNDLAEKGKDISKGGIVTVLFGTGNAQEVALAFLCSDAKDKEIEERKATNEIVSLLRFSLGLDLSDQAAISAMREQLARYVLMSELVSHLGEEVPESLQAVEVAKTRSQIESCRKLAHDWRQRRDLQQSYRLAAERVEEQCRLDKVKLSTDKLQEMELFLSGERALLDYVENALLEDPSENLLELARNRQSRFWAEAEHLSQTRWVLVASAAEVLLEAIRIEKELKKAPAKVETFLSRYAEGDSPWCMLDTHHRHVESHWSRLESDPKWNDDSIDKLINKVRQRYTEVGSEMAKQFVTLFQKARHPLKNVIRQRDIFEAHVRPLIPEKKVAYVWVDALRYEMAKELCVALGAEFKPDVRPALATIPTITEIGMASLLPLANKSAKVVSVGNGKLGLEINGTVIKERKDRIAFFKEHAGVEVADAKLEDLIPKASKKVATAIKSAQLVLITSQEIDELCEKDNVAQARRQMDGVLNDLRRGFRVLGDLGVETIVLAADHGHLFGEELSDDMKIEAPGGETADLHRRVWVGEGGAAEPSYMRASLSSLGVDSELDLATPWTFACFKAKGGAKAYFHGGLSPQEMVIPVAILHPPTTRKKGTRDSGITWSLTPGSKKLSTRFFSVQVAGSEDSLFGITAPRIRVEVRARGKCVSSAVSASYGYEDGTGDVNLRPLQEDTKQVEPCTVTLMIDDVPDQKTVTVVILDAASGVELASIDKIEVAISL